ncbi:glycosyltransferase family 4 protein [Spirosoma sp. KCTC 42546]|uniref:glycosyltransferase n=1 Tax=Spirosoma sp. KCTC 42546 TaxID=2520506 RepID=UPI001157C8BC|nr:glycosyltransferase [Spirosoma sp. KCTC 42546]QDK83103.1 glycosyltransferase family 4 protein [Spirosoma sp. KCTC 42546]
MRKVRVLHVSTAHQPQDPRIVFKQCQTLSEQYEVFCALPNADPTIAPAIHFIRLPYFRRVIWRILLTCPFILLRCLWLRPKLVHVYVPEFLPFAYVFQLLGAKVIYEVQENLHKKMHLKTINNGFLLTTVFAWFDHLARKHFYLIFTEHGYLNTYTTLAKPHEVIYNYPLLPFLEPFQQPYSPNLAQPSFFYIGWLSFERAFDTLVEALAQLKTTYPNFNLHLFGQRRFTERDLATLPFFSDVQDNIHFYGYTDQRIAFKQAVGATVGLALLKPVGDYPESYPTKLFEYMALGLPVITSDFTLYQDIVERHQCGFCVSPYKPAQLAEALIYLADHPDAARLMGQRGFRAVEQFYNWTSEARKLLIFYERILSGV